MMTYWQFLSVLTDSWTGTFRETAFHVQERLVDTALSRTDSQKLPSRIESLGLKADWVVRCTEGVYAAPRFRTTTAL